VLSVLPYRPLAVLLTVVGLGAAGATWVKVAQTLTTAVAPPPAARASAVVWGDRVFSTQTQARRWFRSHGLSYRAWIAKHPEALAVLEHRPRPAVTSPVTPAVKVATPTPKAAAPSSHVAAPAPHTAAPAQVAAPRGGAPLLRYALFALLVLAAGALACGALLPVPFRRRFPDLTMRLWPYRELLGGGAAALVIGLLVGVALS
jgi:hypothetical protein